MIPEIASRVIQSEINALRVLLETLDENLVKAAGIIEAEKRGGIPG